MCITVSDLQLAAGALYINTNTKEGENMADNNSDEKKKSSCGANHIKKAINIAGDIGSFVSSIR